MDLRFAASVFLMGLACSMTSAQQAPARIADGQKITLHGTLRVRHRGFFSYVLLATSKPYLADGGKDEGRKRVALIEIDSDGNQALLSKHAGERVTVEGTLSIGFANPYPYNGVILEKATVTLASGAHVTAKPEAANATPLTLPIEIYRYMLTSTMIPNSSKSGPESIVDLATGRSLPQGNPGYCSLNASQDFMTCACGDGFVPARAGLVPRPLPSAEWKSVPAVTEMWKEMRAAQFEIPEGVRHPIHIQLVCEREAAH